MAKNNINFKKGFTIIEVVLVLAVAGLIFLMVFLALPALQRSQRDTQRRNDYGMLSSAISSYSASNGGKLFRLAGATSKSGSSCKSINPKTYINATGEDPNGYDYQVVACTWKGFESQVTPSVELKDEGTITGHTTEKWMTSDEDDSSESASGDSADTTMGSWVYVVIGADCEGEGDGYNVPQANSSSRAFAIFAYLESGSKTYCSASQ
ncbi:type II secretion system protein [Candidatus Saccharibacteria bacterium]|nr:type II secretion system protein [Candidatus Saccharibacteria bacterium]